MRSTTIGCFLLLMLSAPAYAAPGDAWEEPARACYAQADAFCGERAMLNCSRFWPQVLHCTVASISWPSAPSERRIDYCIDRVQATREAARKCTACGSPIDETMRCILGK